MGIIQRVATRVRGYFDQERERDARQIAVGATGTSSLGSGFDLLSAYGNDAVTAYLQLDQGLLERFADYDDMDEYPLVSCLTGDSLVFTLEDGWIPIRMLAERGGDFHVLAYDRVLRSLVPTAAGNARCTGPTGHTKPMVRVVLDDGRTLTCTADHLFLRKDETWCEAGSLAPGERLMPGALRLRTLADGEGTYWEVHQPQADSVLRAPDGKRWMWAHRLVAETLLGVTPGDGTVIHHRDHDTHNNAPGNLSPETHASHAHHHIAGIDNSRFFPEWTDERRAQMAASMRGNTYSRGVKRSSETRQKMSAAGRGRPKSEAHRRAIGQAQPSRLSLTREGIEAALKAGGTIAAGARELGISWSTMNRRVQEYDLQVPEGNHRVLRVEVIPSGEAVYDLTVPGLHNFVCNGVVVHNSALDIYADDTTQEDMQSGRSVWVTSPDVRIQTCLDDLLHRTLGIEDERWEIARNLCKYGNDYEEPLVTEEGVVGLNFLPAPTIRRIEGPRGELYGFVQDFRGKVGYTLQEFAAMLQQRAEKPQASLGPSGMSYYDPASQMEWTAALEDWEVVHMRLRGRQRRSVYGHSVLESARFIYRRLMLLEDSAMIFRLQRAPEKLAFYVNVGSMPSAEALAHVRRVRNEHRKKKYVNSATGRIELKMDAFSQDEDYWIPSRDGQDSTRIETVTSPTWQHMEDINYFKDQLFAAMKIPKTYMGGDDGVVNSVLSSQDVRFARTVLRVQREVKSGLQKVCKLHLAALGIHPDSVEFEIHMTVPSAIFELAQLEARNARADLAGRMKEFVSLPWILKEVFGLADQDIARILMERGQDVMRDTVAQAQAQVKAQAIAPQGPDGAPGGPPGGGGPPGPGESAIPLTTRKFPSTPHRFPRRSAITEREMNERQGPAEERRLSGKLDRLLKDNVMLRDRLKEVRDLTQELRHFQRPSPR